MYSAYFCVGFVIVVFVLTIVLLIFAPKSSNFFSANLYPRHALLSMSKIHKEIDKNPSMKWRAWPDQKNVSGTFEICPLFMFGRVARGSRADHPNVFKKVAALPDVRTCAFFRLGSNSMLRPHTRWKDSSNSTLCMFIVTDAPSTSIDKCGAWVSGELKKIEKNKILLIDCSKLHSLYNDTTHPVTGLMLDLVRPSTMVSGTSAVAFTDEVTSFIDAIERPL
jgi:hypothetical protein